MSRIKEIPDGELVDDYFGSLMERDTYRKLGNEQMALDNQKIMSTIEAELKRRGKLHLIRRKR